MREVGGTPLSSRSIRMRGYYRAVKRGEAWAVKIAHLLISNPMAGMIALVYRNIDINALIYGVSPFVAMLPKDDTYSGKCMPVPLDYDKDDS